VCCDLCDLYEKCREVVSPEALCCSECAQMPACGDSAVAGQHLMDDDEYDDLDDEMEDDDLDGLYDDDFDDDADYEEDEEEDYESRH